MWFTRRRENKSGEAEQALAEAQEALREAKDRRAKMTEMITDVRNIHERNHFAEQIQDMLTRRRRPLHD